MIKNNRNTGYDDDLILDIEDTFSINITKEEAKNIRIVDDLFTLILQKISGKEGRFFFSLIAFAESRSIIREIYRKMKIEIEPIKFPFSKMNFNIYQEFIKDDLPFISSRLVYPKINSGLTVSSTVFLFSISIYLYFTNTKIMIFYSFVIYIAFLIVLAKVTKPLRQIEPDYRISDFAFDLLELRFSDYLKKYNTWNRKEVWMITKKIIGRYSFVEKEKITLNARFIEDLELDVD